MTVNFVIFHHGKKWIGIAANEELAANGETLEELDKNVIKKLKEKIVPENGTVRINMVIDDRTKPFWITHNQYHLDL